MQVILNKSKFFSNLLLAVAFIVFTSAFAQSQTVLTCDAPIPTIKDQMITESTSSYPGNCPCPYFKDRAGRKCGKRSAWNKPDGYEPLCFPSDIDADMLRNYCEVLKLRRGANTN